MRKNRYQNDAENANDHYVEQQLPSYKDVPSTSNTDSTLYGRIEEESNNSSPPNPTWFTQNLALSEIYTCFPNYSSEVDTLYTLINEQALYPPVYYIQIHGKHNETQRDTGAKDSQQEITDFFFRINITHLLRPCGRDKIQFLPDNKRGYRGTRYPSLKPTLTDWEDGDALFGWCQLYVSDPSAIKSFTFSRKIRNHDTQKLYRLIRSAIAEIRYRGQVFITFPATHCKLIVYSPGKVNEWRTKIWVRWVFYLTFLWVLAWPILIFLTSRYETVRCVFYYANSMDSTDPCRKCKVQCEDDWFRSWKKTIQRAAMAGINTGENSSLSDDYRVMTETMLRDAQAIRSENERIGDISGFQGASDAVMNSDALDWGGDS